MAKRATTIHTEPDSLRLYICTLYTEPMVEQRGGRSVVQWPGLSILAGREMPRNAFSLNVNIGRADVG